MDCQQIMQMGQPFCRHIRPLALEPNVMECRSRTLAPSWNQEVVCDVTQEKVIVCHPQSPLWVPNRWESIRFCLADRDKQKHLMHTDSNDRTGTTSPMRIFPLQHQIKPNIDVDMKDKIREMLCVASIPSVHPTTLTHFAHHYPWKWLRIFPNISGNINECCTIIRKALSPPNQTRVCVSAGLFGCTSQM